MEKFIMDNFASWLNHLWKPLWRFFNNYLCRVIIHMSIRQRAVRNQQYRRQNKQLLFCSTDCNALFKHVCKVGRSSVFLLTLKQVFVYWADPSYGNQYLRKKIKLVQILHWILSHYRTGRTSQFVILSRNLEVDRYPSKENLFAQSALLMNAMVHCFSLRWSITSWNDHCI